MLFVGMYAHAKLKYYTIGTVICLWHPSTCLTHSYYFSSENTTQDIKNLIIGKLGLLDYDLEFEDLMSNLMDSVEHAEKCLELSKNISESSKKTISIHRDLKTFATIFRRHKINHGNVMSQDDQQSSLAPLETRPTVEQQLDALPMKEMIWFYDSIASDENLDLCPDYLKKNPAKLKKKLTQMIPNTKLLKYALRDKFEDQRVDGIRNKVHLETFIGTLQLNELLALKEKMGMETKGKHSETQIKDQIWNHVRKEKLLGRNIMSMISSFKKSSSEKGEILNINKVK